MAPKFSFALFLILVSFSRNAESASILERSYEYVVSMGKSLGPNLMMILDCFGEEEVWLCAREKAGKMLDGWDSEVNKQRAIWQDAADEEVRASGRSMEDLPSKIGRDVEMSLNSLAEVVGRGMARALARKHESGGIDTITLTTSQDKKKMKKKKQKPAKIQFVAPVMMKQRQEKGRGFPGVQTWSIGQEERDLGHVDVAKHIHANVDTEHLEVAENDSSHARFDENVDSVSDLDGGVDLGTRKARGLIGDLWAVGDKALDAVAEQAVETDNLEDGIEDKSSIEEQRGKKKKKKKAILKLLMLGAVLKAKIGTLLQILSFKLQVKFFIIALIGLGINLARLWIEIKNKHQPPQKVIYYEHAQHQHHYDHEEEPGWGPWSRSMEPAEDAEAEIDVDSNSPYRAHTRQVHPLLTRA